jgi:hypothetical protein
MGQDELLKRHPWRTEFETARRQLLLSSTGELLMPAVPNLELNESS